MKQKHHILIHLIMSIVICVLIFFRISNPAASKSSTITSKTLSDGTERSSSYQVAEITITADTAKDIKELGAKPIASTDIVAASIPTIQTIQPGTFQLNEKFSTISVPMANIKSTSPATIETIERKYHLHQTISITAKDEIITHNKLVIIANNKEHVIPIQATTNFTKPSPKLMLKPSFHFGASASISPMAIAGAELSSNAFSVSPGIHIAILQYGASERQPEALIVKTGISYNLITRRPQLEIIPVSFRILPKVLPNTYVGPSISTDIRKNMYVGLSVGAHL